MAQAYVPIQTQILTGNAASVTFDNIPQTYTDLKVVVSPRVTGSSSPSLWMDINGTTSGYSGRFISGNGASAGSGTRSYAHIDCGVINYSTTTSNTFSSHDIYIPNYTSSNNKSISIDVVQESNATTAYMYLLAGLWSNSSAITKLVFTVEDASNLVQHSTFTLYGIGGTRASGGTITADARYTYHTFTSTGTFTALEKIKGAEIMLIGGGGGGGSGLGGGGGAGGIALVPGQTLTAGTSFTAVIGAGGSASGGTYGAVGSNSTFASFSGLGGGGGSSGSQGSFPTGNGGSGGGGGNGFSGGIATQPSVTTVFGYGNNGGGDGAAAGGGGAGAVGGQNNTYGAAGGAGTSLFDSWARATNTGVLSSGLYYYAGGGAGSQDRYNQGSLAGGIGGVGGGGDGADAGGSSQAGTANTGGGGGGGGNNSGVGNTGGSGLVIIRYPN